MIRKFKALGLAFVAVAAMSMVAGAAGAQGAQLHASTAGANTTLHGTQVSQHVFRITGATGPAVTCSTATFQSSTATGKTASEGQLTPTYTGCTAFGQAATVRMNGCEYKLSGATALTSEVDVVGCETSKPIEVQTAICQITVPAQNNIAGHLTYASGGGSPVDVLATATASGIEYQLHGAVCGHAVTLTTTDGTYNGTATIKAFEDAGEAQVTHEGHQTTVRGIGAGPVALTAT